MPNFGAAPAIVMSQLVGASDVLIGSSVSVEYQVANQGNVALSDVSLSGGSYVSGDTNADSVLDVGEVWTYSQASLAAAGSHTLAAEVYGPRCVDRYDGSHIREQYLFRCRGRLGVRCAVG